MNGGKLLFVYSGRIVRRQWRRFILSFLSLGITALVMTLTLLLSSSSGLLLETQAKQLLGGDVVLKSTQPFVVEEILSEFDFSVTAQSKQMSFSATLQSKEVTTPFSVKLVDESFPLYGEIVLENGYFSGVGEDELYLDEAGAQKLKVAVGDSVTFGRADYIVAGVIVAEPTSLLASFRFFPQVIMSQAGFNRALINPELLRAEYSSLLLVDRLSANSISELIALEADSAGNLDVAIAGVSRTGPEVGVEIVADFLIIAVLITVVLAAVNVYASTLYLVTVERKTLAILMALGLSKRRLGGILALALLYVVLVSGLAGSFFGVTVFNLIQGEIAIIYGINLPTPAVFLYLLLCVGLIFMVTVASFVPAVFRTLSHKPKQLLSSMDILAGQKISFKVLGLLSVFTLFPLTLLAIFLLGSIQNGLLSMAAIAFGYLLIALIFSVSLNVWYRARFRFSFYVRNIIAQKKADGLFGIISFSSLFVAMTALSTLALLQISLERFLQEDLSRTVPSTYVLDVQPSQRDGFLQAFPQLELFSSLGARLIEIDGVKIQEELNSTNSTVNRELGREFNLTVREDLQPSEKIVSGLWSEGKSGTVSVDAEFAKRANIKLGSKIVFSIQGFPVETNVTSLRQTDSRSGLPFFYFVLSPTDVADFSGVYFGYAYFEDELQKTLGAYAATEAPNVSVIETDALAPLLLQIVETLLLLVLVVTLPPLLIATLLVTTLIMSSYTARRREGGRLRALGAKQNYVLALYLGETLSVTLLASLAAYVVGVGLTFILGRYYLGLNLTAFFDLKLLFGFLVISGLVSFVALYLFKSDTMPLRELLSYGDTQ